MTVVHLPGVDSGKTVSSQPQGDLVKKLEEILEKAKTGEVQAVAFAVIGDDRSIATSWAGGFVVNELMSAVSWLYFRYGLAFNSSPSQSYTTKQTDE
jgi:hypothetical protein